MGNARAYISVLTPNDTLLDPTSQPHCAGSFAGAVASIAQRTDILREKSRNFAMAAISTVVTHQTGQAFYAAGKHRSPPPPAPIRLAPHSSDPWLRQVIPVIPRAKTFIQPERRAIVYAHGSHFNDDDAHHRIRPQHEPTPRA